MDDGSFLPQIFAIIILILLAAFFALCETAISAASRPKLKAASERGDIRADKAIFISEHFDKAITTLLICTNIVHIAAATIVTVTVARIWGLGAVTAGTIITTILLFFVGEMLPKTIAKVHADSLVLSVSGILKFLMAIFSPLSALLAAIGNRVFGKNKAELTVTEDEIYDIIEDMTEEGTLDEEQGDLISSALQFGNVTVENVLTPRVDVSAINIDDSPENILKIVKESNHSRLPVFRNTIDNIIGILQIRKFIREYLKYGNEIDLTGLLDEAVYVHSSTKIDDLLPIMSKRKTNIAIVTDNYGGTLGIITVEDILEELVGEIWDEDDIVEENVTLQNDGTFIVNAEESVSDTFEQIGFEDPEENDDFINTLMGEWAYEQFPTIPEKGSCFTYYGLNITVLEMNHNRILSLHISKSDSREEEIK